MTGCQHPINDQSSRAVGMFANVHLSICSVPKCLLHWNSTTPAYMSFGGSHNVTASPGEPSCTPTKPLTPGLCWYVLFHGFPSSCHGLYISKAGSFSLADRIPGAGNAMRARIHDQESLNNSVILHDPSGEINHPQLHHR